MLTSQHLLAESPIYKDSTFIWVDILKGSVFKAAPSDIGQREETAIFNFDENVSNIVVCNDDTILVTGEKSIYLCNLCDFSQILFSESFEYPSSLRCNDGSVGPDGKYWFGTMEKAPSGLNGRLYSIDNRGSLVDQKAEIGIPNSFIWLDERFVLISDSFLQKTYKVELLESGMLDWLNREVWLDLSQTGGTPDGGALDADGNIWLAVWGDASIHKYSQEGVLLDKIELNALQPTSCAFGGANMDKMLITTATEGMTVEQLSQYPDSGKVLLRNMNVKGRVLPVFELEV